MQRRRQNARQKQTSPFECAHVIIDLKRIEEIHYWSHTARENALGMRQCPLGVVRHSVTVRLPEIPSPLALSVVVGMPDVNRPR